MFSWSHVLSVLGFCCQTDLSKPAGVPQEEGEDEDEPSQASGWIFYARNCYRLLRVLESTCFVNEVG